MEADMEKFPCLKFAYEAAKIGGTMPTVISGADEVAVSAFLGRKIGFLDIPDIIRQTMSAFLKEGWQKKEPSLDDIIATDTWAKNFAEKLVQKACP